MARLVEMVAHSSVPVVSHCPSMLCAPVSTGPSGAHFPHILGWFPEALSSSMRAGDGIAHIGVVAGDVLPNRPGLACQGAGVCPAVAGVEAAQAPRLAALLEPCL